ncbi:energy-coupling factor ABC transporter permease [Patescibacteria group bacterium]|nr:energy-coupling factor ABC transporter permease [Candidatus Margulisiibacteriota bacterium]MBU1682666.1 energy-coupling factor ABC transporter permease [Patescibacteria group bacterium]
MHIPGGFLSGKPCWVTNLVSGGLLFAFLSKVKAIKDKSKLVYYSLVTALIFALQMLNFPINNGTSGHFLGGALAFLVAGPYLGTLMISVVLAVQALFFNDGGIVCLGANILCMGIVGVWTPYLIHKIISTYNKALSIFIASWSSVVTAAITCSFLLAISGTIAFNKVFPAMVGIHSLIGIGEALLTLVVYFLFIDEKSALKISNAFMKSKNVLVPLALTAIILATFISPFASSFPDGLEKVAELKGFISKAINETLLISPMADYSMPLVKNSAISTGSAGFIGTLLSFIFAALTFFSLKRPKHTI